MCRYLIIEPQYSDPDTFCHFMVGSNHVRASIQIYADLCMFEAVAVALTGSTLQKEYPDFTQFEEDDDLFYFLMTVLPHDGKEKCIRFRIFQDWPDDGVPYRADIRFYLSPVEADEFAATFKAWCANPEYLFVWKGD